MNIILKEVSAEQLRVPKHRDGQPFKTMRFDAYSCSEAALVATMAEMVVNGVSAWKVK